MGKRGRVQQGRQVALKREEKPVMEQLRHVGEERAKLASALHELEGVQFRLVLDARLAGHTWAAIGEALGVSAQALHKRYAPTGKRP